jgi:hypothetical protein
MYVLINAIANCEAVYIAEPDSIYIIYGMEIFIILDAAFPKNE